METLINFGLTLGFMLGLAFAVLVGFTVIDMIRKKRGDIIALSVLFILFMYLIIVSGIFVLLSMKM